MPRGYPKKLEQVVVEQAPVVVVPAPERLPSLHEVAALIYAARVGRSAVVTPEDYALEAYSLARVFVRVRTP